jgi:NADPH2:quinone reductase
MNDATPATMQAVRLDEIGGILTLHEIPVPQPGPGQVLVRMAASPINPTDLIMLQRAGQPTGQALPFTPGREGCGTVVAGDGIVGRFLKGRRVACAARVSGGTWAQYLVTSATACVPLKKGVPWDQAAMLIVNPLTALAFLEIARHGQHRAIVSTGAAGALGGMLLRLGQRENLPIIHIVRRREQVDLVRERDGELVLNSSEPDFVERLRKAAQQLNATLLLDAIGGEMTSQLAEAAPFGSTILLYASLSLQDSVINGSTARSKNLQYEGWYLPNWLRHKNFIQTLLFTGKAQDLLSNELKSPIHRRLPLAAAQQALEAYRADMTTGKILLVADPNTVALSG